MKIALWIVGILLVLMGGVWILQGANVLTQGGMAGKSMWSIIGSIVAVVGIVLIILGASRKRKTA